MTDQQIQQENTLNLSVLYNYATKSHCIRYCVLVSAACIHLIFVSS